MISPLSFDKGCYLGQEVVTRVHRLGRLSSRFISAIGTGDLPGVPFSLTDGERVIGALTSVAKNHDKFIALGWLKSRYEDGPISSGGWQLQVSTISRS
jgi:folate-binding Fe-S cluster repair protein YgfZ